MRDLVNVLILLVVFFLGFVLGACSPSIERQKRERECLNACNSAFVKETDPFAVLSRFNCCRKLCEHQRDEHKMCVVEDK